jgi:hypothetical protein
MKKPKKLPSPYKFADGGPLHDRDINGKLLQSTYASALGNMFREGGPFGEDQGVFDYATSIYASQPGNYYRTGGQFPRPYSLPEDSFKQGGTNLHNSVYASSSAPYPGIYATGGVLGGPGDPPIKEQNAQSLPITAQDYIDVYNNSIALQNYMKSRPEYTLRDPSHISNKYLKEKYPTSEKIYSGLDDANKTFNSFTLKNNPEGQRTVIKDGKTMFVLPNEISSNDYFQKIDENKFKQRELSSGIINVDIPFAYYDKRIPLSAVESYINQQTNDAVQIPIYDPAYLKEEMYKLNPNIQFNEDGSAFIPENLINILKQRPTQQLTREEFLINQPVVPEPTSSKRYDSNTGKWVVEPSIEKNKIEDTYNKARWEWAQKNKPPLQQLDLKGETFADGGPIIPAIATYNPTLPSNYAKDYAARLKDIKSNPIDPKTGAPYQGSGGTDAGSTGTGGNYRAINPQEKAAKIAELESLNINQLRPDLLEQYLNLKNNKPYFVAAERSDKIMSMPYDLRKYTPMNAAQLAIAYPEPEPPKPTIGYATDPYTGKIVPGVSNVQNDATFQVNRQMSQFAEAAYNTPEASAKRAAIDSERLNNIELLKTMTPEQKAAMRAAGLTPAQYLANPFAMGGKLVVAGGEKHRIYEKTSPTGNGEGVEGHIMVNHPTEDKGQWDTIDLTTKAGAKTVAEGIAATKQWHAEHPNQYAEGGSILSMSNTPQLEGEGKDLTYPDGAYVYNYGGKLFAPGGPIYPTNQQLAQFLNPEYQRVTQGQEVTVRPSSAQLLLSNANKRAEEVAKKNKKYTYTDPVSTQKIEFDSEQDFIDKQKRNLSIGKTTVNKSDKIVQGLGNVLEYTGVPGGLRTLDRLKDDPLKFAENVGITARDLYNLPQNLAYQGVNYLWGDGKFNLPVNTEALGVTLDAAGMLPFIPKGTSRAVKQGVKMIGDDIGRGYNYLTTQTPLRNAYNYNPLANRTVPMNRLFHGTDNPNLLLDDIKFTDPNPNVGSRPGTFKQRAAASGDPLEMPGGFYTNDRSVPGFMGNNNYRYSMDVPANAKVFKWETGPSDNISVKRLQELKNEGYDIIQGKNIIGEIEYIPLKKDLISNWKLHQKGDPELKLLKDLKFKTEQPHWLKGYKEALIESPGLPNTFTKSGLGGMDMSNHVIKNVDYYTQLLNTYNSKALPAANRKFYKDLIANVKKQDGLVTERQLNELKRLATGNFNFGKKAYNMGGQTTVLKYPNNSYIYRLGGYYK